MDYYLLKYKGRTLGESGESCKSEYDHNDSCVKCGTGAKLIDNLKVKGFSRINKDLFETLDGDLIISLKLYEIIKSKQIDLELKQVVDTKGNYLNFFHFYSPLVLPRFNIESSGYITEDQCDRCNRNGYYNHTIIGVLDKNIPTQISPLNLIYTASQIEALDNNLIINTWECQGLSHIEATGNRVVRYARPWLIINKSLKDILEIEHIPGLIYNKIIVI